MKSSLLKNKDEPDIDKSKWMLLATSIDGATREIALTLIHVIADEIQEELILWYFWNSSAHIRKTILENLNDDSRKEIQEIQVNNDSEQELVNSNNEFPKPYIDDHKFGELYREYLIEHKSKPLLLKFMEKYEKHTGCGVFKAKEIYEKLK